MGSFHFVLVEVVVDHEHLLSLRLVVALTLCKYLSISFSFCRFWSILRSILRWYFEVDIFFLLVR